MFVCFFQFCKKYEMVIGRREKAWEIFYQIKGLYQNNSQITVQQGKKWFELSSTFKILLAKKQDFTHRMYQYLKIERIATPCCDSKYILVKNKTVWKGKVKKNKNK